MIYRILMIVGAILIGAGFIGIMALVWAPFFSAIRAVFYRDKDDLLYQTAAGQSYLRKENAFLIKICIFLILMGALMYGIGYYVTNGPRGYGSIWEHDIPGIGPEDKPDDVNLPSDNDIDNDKRGGESSNETGDIEHYIYISDCDVRIDNMTFDDISGFEAYIKEKYNTSQSSFILVDDYAVKRLFDETERIVKDNGYVYQYSFEVDTE